MILLGVVLLVIQGGLLFAWYCGIALHEKCVFKKYFNPVAWFCFFYTFWFLLPQAFSLITDDHFIVGMEYLSSGNRLRLIFPTQMYLLFFIAIVCLTNIVTLRIFRSHQVAPTSVSLELKRVEIIFMYSMFISGVVASGILGDRFVDLENGYRSTLVKTSDGQVLTAIGIFGGVSFAVLFCRNFLFGNRFSAISIFFIFSASVIFTGARGRLLWPILLSVAFIFSYKNHFPILKIVLLGLLMLCVLVTLDPIVAAIKSDAAFSNSSVLNIGDNLVSLFYKRNFDAFSNFCLIVTSDLINYDFLAPITGARDLFMNAYYPLVYEDGVGFGVTFPGAFWIAGNLFGLAFYSVFFGIVITALVRWMYSIESQRSMWLYFFLMPYFFYLGGNFSENIKKMIVTALLPLIWMLIARLKIGGRVRVY